MSREKEESSVMRDMVLSLIGGILIGIIICIIVYYFRPINIQFKELENVEYKEGNIFVNLTSEDYYSKHQDYWGWTTDGKVFHNNRAGLMTFQYPVKKIYYRRISKMFTTSGERYVIEVIYDKDKEDDKAYLYLLEHTIKRDHFCESELALGPFKTK